MKIFEMGCKLTENVKLGIQRTEKYLNNWGDFAMIDENVFIPLEKTKLKDGIEVVKQEVNEIMDRIFGMHPDFNCYLMNDNYMLVLVCGIAGVFDKEKMSDEDYGNQAVRFERAMILRNKLFEACERREILALVDIEKND